MSYLVVTIKQVKDETAFQQYAQRVKPMIEQYGGKYLAIDKSPEVHSGQWPYVRTVIVSFPSFAAMRNWYDSPEYQAIVPLRQRAIDANIALVHDLADVPVPGYP